MPMDSMLDLMESQLQCTILKKTKKTASRSQYNLFKKSIQDNIYDQGLWGQSLFHMLYEYFYITACNYHAHSMSWRYSWGIDIIQRELNFLYFLSSNRIGTVTQLYSYDFVFRYLWGKTGPCPGNNTPQKLQVASLQQRWAVATLKSCNDCITEPNFKIEYTPPKLNLAPENACLEDDIFLSG